MARPPEAQRAQLSRVFWTERALEDLQGISIYIESNSTVETANRVCGGIYDSIQQLRRFPELGRPGLRAGTRELVVAEFPNYIVVYRLLAHAAVEVLSIRHGAQQQ